MYMYQVFLYFLAKLHLVLIISLTAAGSASTATVANEKYRFFLHEVQDQ